MACRMIGALMINWTKGQLRGRIARHNLARGYSARRRGAAPPSVERAMRQKTLLEDIALVVALAVAIVAVALTMPIFSAKAAQPPAVRNGLAHMPSAKVKLAYVLPGTNWNKYKTIQLHALEVPPDARDATPKGTMPRYRESYILGDKEVAALQDVYADSMKKVFGNAGFTFVDQPKDDTLVIAARVLKIRLSAPLEHTRQGYAGRSRTYTQGAGSMIIGAVLADGQTGRVIAEVADARAPTDIWRINNRVTNLADARQMFGDWARRLRDTIGR